MKAVRMALPLVAVVVMTLCTSSAEAQRGRGMWGRNGDSLLNLLMNEKVQKELSFVDDQADMVEELQNEYREEMRFMFEDMRNNNDGGDRQEMFDKMREKMKGMNNDFDSKAEELLIEDQIKRLKQLQNQSRMRGGLERALENESFRDSLGITDEQMEELKEKAEEVREWSTEQFNRIRKEAQDKVLSVLTADQRKKIKDMTGDEFEFDQNQGRNRGNGRGNNGGDNGRGNGQGNRQRSDF